jgi:hypothetical protein
MEEKPTVEQLVAIDNFLNNLERHERTIRSFIDSDFINGGVAKEYIEDAIEEDEDNQLTLLINKENKEKTIEEQLLTKIYIQRIGFYPNDNQYAIFDFYLNHEISNQILVVIIENDKSYSITWES